MLEKGGEPIDLTGCQVFISISNRIYRDECIILDAEAGKVSYLVSNISDKSGFYKYEYIVKYAGGTEERLPNDSYKDLTIVNEIEGVL